jgi:hypothetical protein
MIPRPAASLLASTCVTTTPLSLYLDAEFVYQALAQRRECESQNISLGSDFLCGRRWCDPFIAANRQRTADRREANVVRE